MGSSKGTKKNKIAEKSEDFTIAEPVVAYGVAKQTTKDIANSVTFIVDPGLDKYSNMPLTGKAAEAKAMFDKYYEGK
jgi:hypothetical protein